jgi:hypothetical protein
MWESDQDAGTISSVLFAAAGTTVGHSLKHFNGVIDLGKQDRGAKLPPQTFELQEV